MQLLSRITLFVARKQKDNLCMSFTLFNCESWDRVS